MRLRAWRSGRRGRSVSSGSPIDTGAERNVLFLYGAHGLEQLLADFLQVAKALLIVDKEAIVFQRMFSIEVSAQHHIAQVHRVGQDGIVVQFFEGGGWVVVIHVWVLGVECDDASRGRRDARVGRAWGEMAPQIR